MKRSSFGWRSGKRGSGGGIRGEESANAYTIAVVVIDMVDCAKLKLRRACAECARSTSISGPRSKLGPLPAGSGISCCNWMSVVESVAGVGASVAGHEDVEPPRGGVRHEDRDAVRRII